MTHPSAAYETKVPVRQRIGSLFAHLGSALTTAIRQFPRTLLRYPWVVAFLLVYTVARVVLDRSVGASWGNTLRPLVMSLFFNAVYILIIDTLYFLNPTPSREEVTARQSPAARHRPRHSLSVLAVLLLVWAFWALDIIDGLQVQGAIGGTPVLSWLPGWRALDGALLALGDRLGSLAPGVPAYAWTALIANLLLRVILPGLVLWLLGERLRDAGLSFRRWGIAAPLIVISLGTYLAGGVGLDRWLRMGIVLLYPGLTEELFYRGWLQRTLRTWLCPGNAVLLTAILFGFLHLPESIAVRYAGMLPIALSNMGDVILAGLVWGYGVTRTRSVLPWATVHALSDLVGF